MSRVPLLAMDEIPDEYHYLFTEEYLGDRHIFRAWAHNPDVLEATLEYLNTLYSQVTEREKELIILKVAHTKGSEYEWHQHVDIAREKGVSIEDMQAIGREEYHHFDHEEEYLLRYAEAMVDGIVVDSDYDHLNTHYTHGQIVAIGLIVGFYTGLCNYISATDLPFEGGEFIGWVPDSEEVASRFD